MGKKPITFNKKHFPPLGSLKKKDQTFDSEYTFSSGPKEKKKKSQSSALAEHTKKLIKAVEKNFATALTAKPKNTALTAKPKKLDPGVAALAEFIGVDEAENVTQNMAKGKGIPLGMMEFLIGKPSYVGKIDWKKDKEMPSGSTSKKKAPVTPQKIFNDDNKTKMIFSWSFTSGRTVSGRNAVYSTYLHENGEYTCNCQGWVYGKKRAKETGNRACKHIAKVVTVGAEVYKKFKKGEPLPEPENVSNNNEVSDPFAAPKGGRKMNL